MKIKKLRTLVLISIMSTLLVACNSSNTTVIEADAHEVLANKNARQAMQLVINREELIKYAKGYKALTSLIPSGICIDSNGVDYLEFTGKVSSIYDLEEAKKKWNEAKKEIGFTDVTINLEFAEDLYDETMNATTKELERQLEQLDGLNINLITLKPEELGFKTDNQLNIFHLGMDVPIVNTALNSYRGDIGIMAAYNYTNETVNSALNEAAKATTLAEKWRYCFDAESKIMEDAIIYPVAQGERIRLKKKYVQGNEIFATGIYSSYRNAYLTNNSKTIRIGRYSQSQVVGDMIKAKYLSDYDMIYETMDGLVKMNAKSEIEPAIAESWEVSQDAKTWTFNLVKDAKWHNGDPVVAQDFVYGIQRMLNPKNESVLAGALLADIKGAVAYNTGEEKDASTLGIKAIDKYTLQIELENSFPEFINILSLPIAYPQNQKFIEKHGENYGTSVDTMLFNGPFKVKEISDDKLNYTLIKNTDYRKAEDIKLETMIINADTAKNTLEKFKNNELDIILSSPLKEYQDYINSDEFNKENILDIGTSNKIVILVFNPTNNSKENVDTEEK